MKDNPFPMSPVANKPWMSPTYATPLQGATAPATAAGADTDWSDVAGAGITAAGKTTGMLAQIAGEQMARKQQQQATELQRQWQEKMVMEQLKQQQSMFDQSANAGAYRSLLSAFNGQVGNTFDTRANQRTGTRNAADAFATAYLGR